MTINKTILLICLVIFIPSQANAQFFSGSKLFPMLEKSAKESNDFDSGEATGYVLGVVDAGYDSAFCFPDNDEKIAVRQIIRIVYNYMQKHPEKWSKPADLSVTASLQEVYPCKSE